MPYGTPTDPVGGTVITVAYAVANVLDPIRWLRLMTGNADPPGSSYVVVSNSTTGTAWSRIPTDAIADRALTTIKIGIGAVTATEIADLGIPDSKISAVDGSKINGGSIPSGKLAAGAVIASNIADGNVPDAKISSVDGSKINGGSIPSGKLATGAVIASNIADGNVPDAKISSVDGSKLVNGTVTAAKLASGVGAVPSGLIGAFATNAAIASGWVRYTALDGRMPVGAGTTFGVTYIENTDYGSSWGHLHTGPSHTHSGADLSISGNTAASAAANGTQAGAGNSSDPGHTHGPGSLDVAGNTGADGAGNTSSTSWLIPSRAVVWAQKS